MRLTKVLNNGWVDGPYLRENARARARVSDFSLFWRGELPEILMEKTSLYQIWLWFSLVISIIWGARILILEKTCNEYKAEKMIFFKKLYKNKKPKKPK